ncbi:uncharacterized [Tachysurus ichikawai]
MNRVQSQEVGSTFKCRTELSKVSIEELKSNKVWQQTKDKTWVASGLCAHEYCNIKEGIESEAQIPAHRGSTRASELSTQCSERQTVDNRALACTETAMSLMLTVDWTDEDLVETSSRTKEMTRTGPLYRLHGGEMRASFRKNRMGLCITEEV